MKEKIISFPHLGDYHIPIEFLLKKLTNLKVVPSPKITKKTIELGTSKSPDFVCLPFKYNLGNFIESLENGANILIQAGGGCRYGYYAEVQRQILKDLGYNFEFYTLTNTNKITISSLFNTFKKLNPDIEFHKFAYYTLLTLKMIHYMDKIDIYIRANIGFEEEKGSFQRIKKKMLNEFKKTKNFTHLLFLYYKYKRIFKKLKINKPKNCLKVGIIGELYTSMEPFSSYFLEEELAKKNIQIKRYTNLTYLLITKKIHTKKMLKYVKDYVHHKIGADGLDNVYRAKKLIEENYDGIIHIKPFGCTPEIGAIPIIDKICKKYKMPIIYFSYDTQTSMEGLKTRIEAFYEMLNMKKENQDGKMLSRN